MKLFLKKKFVFFICITIAACFLFIDSNKVSARNKKKMKGRLLVMAVEYPGIEMAPDETASMDIIFHNRGNKDENVTIWVDKKPEEFKTKIKTYQYRIMGLHVPSGEDKTITFEAVPEKNIKPGEYLFVIKSKTDDDKFNLSQNLIVKISNIQKDKTETKGIKIVTSYPVLRGPSDGKFEFSVEVESKLEKDAVFDLFAKGPELWDINFKPAYETKYISSLRIKSSQSSTVAVEVKPPANAKQGEYNIDLSVASGNAKAEAKLTVHLTGTYGLDAGTSDGLLSLNARQGKTSNVSIYVKNTGTANNNDISFMSFKPENWKVEFNPEKIDSLNPGDFKQVEISITPNDEALVGDYSVTIKVESEKVSKDIEFRVTVKASAAWAWIGILIIIGVIGGLTFLFHKLGRR